MFADLDVMAYLHQVVEFHSRGDLRSAQRATIHAGVGSNLYIVTDLHGADLREFHIAFTIKDVSEPVAANNRARVDDHFPAEARPGVEGHVGVQPAPGANPRTAPDKTKCADFSAHANCHVLLDHRVRSNSYIRTEFCTRSDHRGSVSSSRDRLRCQ